MMDIFHVEKTNKLSKSFVSLKQWWRKSWARSLNLYRVIMMVTSTQEDSFREGRKHAIEVHILLDDARENVGAPTSQCRKRGSSERYTGYMDLMCKFVVKRPSSFKEAVQQ